jgi:DNA-directed RNA polymerase specialized sigma24 family protein
MLMLQVRDGDADRLGVLFERYCRRLFDFLSRTMGNRTAAEDLAQHVCCQILKFGRTFRDDSRFKRRMFHIARSVCATCWDMEPAPSRSALTVR